MTGKELSIERKKLFKTQHEFAEIFTALGFGKITPKTVSDYEKKVNNIPSNKEKQFLTVIEHFKNKWLWDDYLTSSSNYLIKKIINNFSNSQFEEVILWCNCSTHPITEKEFELSDYEKALITLCNAKALILLGNDGKGKANLKKVEDYCLGKGITKKTILSKCENAKDKDEIQWCQLWLDTINQNAYFDFKELYKIKDTVYFLPKNKEIYDVIKLLIDSIRKIEHHSVTKETKYLWNKLNLVSPDYGNDEREAEQTVYELLNLLRKDLLKSCIEVDPIVIKCLEWESVKSQL